jgi:hypothetical protein
LAITDLIKSTIDRENYQDMLRDVECPHCFRMGAFSVFAVPNNNGTGLECACGRRHPLAHQGIMWLRVPDKKRREKAPENLEQVLERCGRRCWGCGFAYDRLQAHGVGFHVHDTLPYAAHGHEGELIPLCVDCHAHVEAVKRSHAVLIAPEATDDAA